MSMHAADLNLLFGIMAVQNDFISRDALVEAMGAWVLDKSRRLGEILVDRGHLTPERCALLDALVNEHLKMHENDPERSLAAVASVSSLRQQLSQLADPDVQASLQIAGSAAAPGPESTLTYEPAEQTAGLRYRILRPHAKGGLGEVFVAEDLELHREVALKEIQPCHSDDPDSRGRFLLEAEVTGRLEHPGIVPVYSLGQYADGRPFYAMRFVHGDNLKEAIRRFHEADTPGRDPGERSLALRQLLGRFVDVCNAVAYAHSRGVLHRDLKPGNIMLGRYGETLVVDWGLAKTVGRTDATTTADETTLQPSSGSGAGATQMGTAIGTPAYMSPEQAAGQLDRIGPASDVYSLGATLYTLLTGRPPFQEEDRGQLLQKVQQGDFEPPRKISKHVPAALEAICLKAMARNPEDRYPTARALALDVEHWLGDEPVSAWREPMTLRTQRWARRHRAMVASTAAALVVAIVGLVVGFVTISAAYDSEYAARVEEQEAKERAIEAEGVAENRRIEAEKNLKEAESQRVRADANFAKAMAAVDDYLTKISETRLLETHGTQSLRKDLLTSALGFYLAFLKERKDDPNVRVAVANAYLRVTKINAFAGDVTEARKAMAEALARFEELAEQRPDDLELQHGLAECYDWSNEEAKAIAIWRELCRARPDDAKFLKGLAGALNSSALKQDKEGDRKGALQSHQEALAVQDRIVQLQPDDAEAHYSIGVTLNDIGALLARTGRQKDALAMYQRSVHHKEIAYARMPGVTHYGRSLAVGLDNVAGTRLALGEKSQEVLDLCRRSLEICQGLVREDPAMPWLPPPVYNAHIRLVALLAQAGRRQEAVEVERQLESFMAAIPKKNKYDWYNLACARARLWAWVGDGKPDLSDAERRHREQLCLLALQSLEEAVSQGYDDEDWTKKHDDLKPLRDRPEFKVLFARMEKAMQVSKLARDAAGAATPDEKLKITKQALAIREKLAAEEPSNLRHQVDVAFALHSLGLLYLDLRDYEKAEQSLSRALTLREKIVKDAPKTTAHRVSLGATRASLGATRIELGKLQWLAGRHQEAEASWDRGVKLFEDCIHEETDNQSAKEVLSQKLIEIAEEYGKLMLWEEANERFAKAFAAREPNDPSQWLRRGHLLLINGDAAAYRGLCKRAFERFGIASVPAPPSDDPLVLAFLCSCGPDSGVNAKEVARLAEIALARAPKDIIRNCFASWANFRAGDFDKALQRAASCFASWRQHMFTLAVAYHGRGDRAAATYWLAAGERANDEALARSLQAPFSWPVISPWYAGTEIETLAREAHSTIQGKAAPDNPWIHLVQGRAHAHIGKPEKTEKDFAAAVAAQPGDPKVWIARARIFAELDQHGRAEADFAKAIALTPNDPRPWIARGRYLAERGKHNEADADLARAAALSPEELNVFPESGWWVAGPYPVDINLACSPEEHPSPDKSIPAPNEKTGWETKWLQWRPVATEANGVVQLGRVFETQPLPTAAGSYYGLCYVYSRNQRDANLHVGSGAPLRVWLNSKLVHESRQRTYSNQPGVAAVRFESGMNKILVKVSCSAADQFHFYCRVDDSREDRGFVLAKRGLWEEAANLLAEENEKTAWLELDYLKPQILSSLFKSKGMGNQEALRRLADRFALTSDPWAGWNSACTILPSLDFDVKTAPLVSLTEMGRSVGYLKDPLVGFHIAWAKFRVGKVHEAHALAKDIDKHNYPPNDLLLAMTSFTLGDKEEAQRRLKTGEDWYLAAIRSGLQAPNFIMPESWEDWGRCQIIYREAKTLVEGKPYADEPLWLIATGRERALLGYKERAEKDFQEAVTIRPDDWEVWAWRGRVSAQLGRYEEAAADLGKAEKLAKGAQQFFDVARMYTFAATAAEKASPKPVLASKSRDEWRGRALACLKQSVAAGFKDATRLERERDLDALRGGEEFQALLKGIRQQGK